MTKLIYEHKAQIPESFRKHSFYENGKHVVNVAPQAELDARQTKIDTMVMRDALIPFFEDDKYDLKPSALRAVVPMAMEEFEVRESGEIRNRNIAGSSLKKWVRTDLRKTSPFLYVHGNATELDKSGEVWVPNESARKSMTTDELWNAVKKEARL